MPTASRSHRWRRRGALVATYSLKLPAGAHPGRGSGADPRRPPAPERRLPGDGRGDAAADRHHAVGAGSRPSPGSAGDGGARRCARASSSRLAISTAATAGRWPTAAGLHPAVQAAGAGHGGRRDESSLSRHGLFQDRDWRRHQALRRMDRHGRRVPRRRPGGALGPGARWVRWFCCAAAATCCTCG